MAESPISPLSSLSSDEFTEDPKHDDRDPSIDALPDHFINSPHMRPLKRQRVSSAADRRSFNVPNDNDTETDISSDTSGSVPGSPTNTSQPHDEEANQEQVTVCHWDGCPAGDLGNMDVLVEHIHDEHIGTRQKIYSCEWQDCNRKGMSHASGYALRAHMRSHTKEKPFFCQLPECDRSFTRSDALAKHMRTVHETEALRPSDPIPRNHSNPPPRNQRLKLILSAKPPDTTSVLDDQDSIIDDDATVAESIDMDGGSRSVSVLEPYPPELQFTEEESALPTRELYRLLRRQLHWTEEENRQLATEVETLEAKRKQEWIQKELLLENVLEAELAHHTHKLGAGVDERKLTLVPEKGLPMTGKTAWYREVKAEPDVELKPPGPMEALL
ncbi:MAG: hypothetical protein M1817_001632 [Caeruleum heppii]|nr:MAG: hypothetical protein M1817_001632 [Caeruleum heppii]